CVRDGGSYYYGLDSW
nr:immunoglobulin heavy chain junction region [Macaca mulatta]MPN84020.1 immunoglobulin heavy chain junction region [Macaca mulatta]MPN84138.1 immunoglobulin heavy chain junction region [Macaca mulatta]MPN84144.1 immunoglobulin heavy chain junction region [Macaca mulatta]MPN84429.1 immunoglobulin heavy chain junction region [Macaca mulatta]